MKSKEIDFQERFDRLEVILSEIKEQNDTIFDTDQCCRYLSISKSFLYKLTMYNKITHYRVGKRVYFSKRDVDAWIKDKANMKTASEIEQVADDYVTFRNKKK